MFCGKLLMADNLLGTEDIETDYVAYYTTTDSTDMEYILANKLTVSPILITKYLRFNHTVDDEDKELVWELESINEESGVSYFIHHGGVLDEAQFLIEGEVWKFN